MKLGDTAQRCVTDLAALPTRRAQLQRRSISQCHAARLTASPLARCPLYRAASLGHSRPEIHPRRVAQDARIAFDEQFVIRHQRRDSRRNARCRRADDRIETGLRLVHAVNPEAAKRQRRRVLTANHIPKPVACASTRLGGN